MAKLVFLDLDGVLNSAEFFKRRNIDALGSVLKARDSGAPDPWRHSEMLDSDLVARLNWLIAQSGAQVVISSSWRSVFSLEEIRTALSEVGFVGEIIGKTPTLGMRRGHEIQAWLSAQTERPEAFVILDDNSDMVHLEPHLVLTTWAHGIQQSHCERALAMLGGSA